MKRIVCGKVANGCILWYNLDTTKEVDFVLEKRGANVLD
jgi:hypothetical protein